MTGDEPLPSPQERQVRDLADALVAAARARMAVDDCADAERRALRVAADRLDREGCDFDTIVRFLNTSEEARLLLDFLFAVLFSVYNIAEKTSPRLSEASLRSTAGRRGGMADREMEWHAQGRRTRGEILLDSPNLSNDDLAHEMMRRWPRGAPKLPRQPRSIISWLEKNRFVAR